MIISKLKNYSGFFSSFFFVMNHYIYCQKHNITFKLDNTDWIYKSVHGWDDYFVNIDKIGNVSGNNYYVSHGQVLENYPLYEYKNIIPQIYVYNTYTQTKIDCTIEFLKLKNKKYDGIYIRRGDKLVNESVFIPTEKYMDLLLQKNPLCSDLFIQTDDYNSVIDIQNYIKEKQLNICLYTLCKPETTGFCVYNNEIEAMKQDLVIPENKEYFLKVKNNILNSTILANMSPTEKFEHTIHFITGVDILLRSNICICDYQSNVSRFIKLAHQQFDNVFNVLEPNKNIDLNIITICPAWQCF